MLDAARSRYGQAFTAVLETARIWVNGDEPLEGEATVLRPGDEVAVLPPVSGGAEGALTEAELEAAGLYRADEEHAAYRLELLRYLLDLGATLGEIEEARDDLPALASTLALRPGRERLTLAEAARRAGVSLDAAVRTWRASGLPVPGPDDRVCTEADVDVLRLFIAGQEFLGEDVAVQVGRVVGSAVARMAEALRSAFLVQVGAPTLAEDPVGLALARANVDAVAFIPGVSRALDVLLRHHLALAQRPIDVQSGIRGYDSQHLTVGFVDLVGSTALAQQLAIGELGVALGEFETIAADTVAAGSGRLVKLIGDEAMFVVADATAACEIALQMVDELAAHAVLPPARGGLATGDVLTREGDYFGPVVNLAARAVKLGAPGAVLASVEVCSAADPYRFASIGEQTLRGFDAPVELFRVER